MCQKYTSHYGCSPVLEQQIKETTEDSLLGATMVSPGMSARCRLSENADWVCLSVLADILAGGDLRRLEGVVQVPSVLLKPISDKITYLSCAVCGKGIYETKMCLCASQETKIRYRATLRAEDNTHQVNVVIFAALEYLVKVFADGDSEKEDPQYYHENAARVEQLMLATEAMPCTILVAFEENSYQKKMRSV